MAAILLYAIAIAIAIEVAGIVMVFIRLTNLHNLNNKKYILLLMANIYISNALKRKHMS